MGGGKGGGGGGSAPPNPYESVLASIAQTEYDRAKPLRDSSMDQFMQLIQGSFNPKTSAMYKPIFDSLRSAAGAGESQSRDAILAGTARGGGQTEALANLAGNAAAQRAGVESGASNQVIMDLMNKSYGLSSGSPAAAMSGLGQAGQLGMQNQALYQQQQQMASNQGSALGGALGTAGGAGLGALGVALAPETFGTSLLLPMLGGSLLGGGVGRGVGGKK